MLDFLREKRRQKDQLLREQEKTKRIAAQAELVKNLVEAGFTKGEIYQQLQRL
jgi:G:T/U-mismatch repair DNA glycosylase